MKVQARQIQRQTEWPFVADEMNFVPALSKLFAQSGRENSAAAHGGVTGDADFEWRFSHSFQVSGLDAGRMKKDTDKTPPFDFRRTLGCLKRPASQKRYRNQP